jgi:hypothetical protein
VALEMENNDMSSLKGAEFLNRFRNNVNTRIAERKKLLSEMRPGSDEYHDEVWAIEGLRDGLCLVEESVMDGEDPLTVLNSLLGELEELKRKMMQ